MNIQKAIWANTQNLLIDMNISVSRAYETECIPIFGRRFGGYVSFLGTLR